MLTVFSTPKPFSGHIGVIQRNAIRSWQRLHTDIEIILVGDDPGTAEVCGELGIYHIRDVKKNKHGTKYLAGIFDQAQEVAHHKILCHVNCDIILMSDFLRAVQLVLKVTDHFLMAGRRWDVDLKNPLDFEKTDWEKGLRELALAANRQKPAQWIDYFLFSKGLFYQKIPAFVIGRPGWDNWLLWYARSLGTPVIDASSVVCAVHQNHDYSYHPDAEKGVWEGEEAQQNYKLLEGRLKFRTLDNATHLLRPDGIHRNHRHWIVQLRRSFYDYLSPAWFRMLNLTRPLRHRLGLRQKGNSPCDGFSGPFAPP